jgi:hypothetical protein
MRMRSNRESLRLLVGSSSEELLQLHLMVVAGIEEKSVCPTCPLHLCIVSDKLSDMCCMTGFILKVCPGRLFSEPLFCSPIVLHSFKPNNNGV